MRMKIDNLLIKKVSIVRLEARKTGHPYGYNKEYNKDCMARLSLDEVCRLSALEIFTSLQTNIP